MISGSFQFTAGKTQLLAGAPFGQHMRVAADLAREAQPRTIIYVAADDIAAATAQQVLNYFAPYTEALVFPAWDCLPYDRVGPTSGVMAQRVDCLSRLLTKPTSPRIVITTAAAIAQKVPAPEVFRDISLRIAPSQTLDIEQLKAFMARNGYSRVETVREAGEFAIRGSLIDIFPVGAENPARIDLFGDEVEKIRAFDATSQRTSDTIKEIHLKPVSEVMLDDAAIARFRSNYRQQLGTSTGDPLYESVSEGRKYPGMEHWLSLFHGELVPLTAYVPDAVLLLDYQLLEALDSRFAQIDDFYSARAALQKTEKKNTTPVYRPLPPAALYLDKAAWQKLLNAHASGEFSPFAAVEGQGATDCGATRARDFAAERAAGNNFYDAVRDTVRAELQNRRVVLACYSRGSAERLQHVLEGHGLTGLVYTESFEPGPKKGDHHAALALLPLEHGFAAPDVLVLTEQDILGDRLSRPRKARNRSDKFTIELSQLAIGDLVVHNDHGIGQFTGLETLTAGGAPHDCLRIIYDGGDKLFVPVENLEVLTRYGSAGETTQLDKLGGVAWQGRKARVKKRLKDMAEALLKIAAARALQEGERITPPQGLYDEFAARFPYTETEDQDRAIENVFGDMASGKPMDRLVCGDVGFGKTEVAIRAAFAAVQAGMQVAVVVPTTLLARQHYRTFASRFNGYPVRIAQLSRMVTANASKESKKLLAEGKLDIVVGTHALLAKDVKFSNLGLLIVDEEQRFGVKQKEKLKELRANVHVLTLTATPIPRTLQLALTGVRELSLITTAPVDRLSVRTFILPFDPLVLREALMREHYRGGQSFYVCPRIEDLGPLREQLQEMVPELKIATAHGRMTATELDDVMTAFDEARFDILLATNIVESGLDIPNANTIVIHRADMFGLAQLYQLRGRVGRAKQRGYAYMTYNVNTPLGAVAQQRLEVLASLEGLGAGFQLASHDLDIRGAGNLLGEEQSGHIREVGIELYQQMLEDAVAAARAGVKEAANQDDNWTPQINLGMPVLIPETYVPDLGLRLNLYRRAAELHTPEDIEAFAAELIDRFGALPNEVQNLLDTVYIKQLCRQSGVEKLDAGPKGAIVAFHNNVFAKPEKLIGYIQKNSGTVKVRPDQKLSCIRVWDEPRARLKGIQKMLGELVELAA